jgi:hypothetical protein
LLAFHRVGSILKTAVPSTLSFPALKGEACRATSQRGRLVPWLE